MKRRVSWDECDPSGRIRFQAVFDWEVDAEECVRGAVTAVHVVDGRPAPLPDDVRAALDANGSNW